MEGHRRIRQPDRLTGALLNVRERVRSTAMMQLVTMDASALGPTQHRLSRRQSMFESLFKPFNRPIRRGCLVYASPGLDKCLVTRCAFDDGVLIGLSNATEMVSFSDIDRLGLAIEAALLACSDNARSEPPRRKDTDGPSYKASGMRTLKSFKENYIPITFLAANDANIIYVANGPVLGSNDLGLRSSGTSAKDYGHMVHALVSGSEHMKP